jgi:hypothetical protein
MKNSADIILSVYDESRVWKTDMKQITTGIVAIAALLISGTTIGIGETIAIDPNSALLLKILCKPKLRKSIGCVNGITLGINNDRDRRLTRRVSRSTFHLRHRQPWTDAPKFRGQDVIVSVGDRDHSQNASLEFHDIYRVNALKHYIIKNTN